MNRSPISTVKPDTIATSILTVATRGPGFSDITDEVAGFVVEARAREGALHLHVRHTSASLMIQENADPDVLRDLMTALDGLAPQDAPYRHASEGPDDMPAHIKAMLTSVSLSIPVVEGRTALGTWQGVYVIEHRSRQHARTRFDSLDDALGVGLGPEHHEVAGGYDVPLRGAERLEHAPRGAGKERSIFRLDGAREPVNRQHASAAHGL